MTPSDPARRRPLTLIPCTPPTLDDRIWVTWLTGLVDSVDLVDLVDWLQGCGVPVTAFSAGDSAKPQPLTPAIAPEAKCSFDQDLRFWPKFCDTLTDKFPGHRGPQPSHPGWCPSRTSLRINDIRDG